MNKLLYFYCFTIVFFLFSSCEQGTTKQKKQINSNNKKNELVFNERDFQDKLRNKEKMFSEFWLGMSKAEFNAVEKILIQKGTMDEKGNYLFSCSLIPVNISSFFNNDKLEEIFFGTAYSGSSQCFYNLYANKYRLEKLKTKKERCSCYKTINELHPKYEHKYFTEEEKNKDNKMLKDRFYEIKELQANPRIINKGEYLIVIEAKYSNMKDDYTIDKFLEGKNYDDLDRIALSISLSKELDYRTICNVPKIYFWIRYIEKSKHFDKEMNLKNEIRERKRQHKQKEDRTINDI